MKEQPQDPLRLASVVAGESMELELLEVLSKEIFELGLSFSGAHGR
jgi:hypothetical protein